MLPCACAQHAMRGQHAVHTPRDATREAGGPPLSYCAARHAALPEHMSGRSSGRVAFPMSWRLRTWAFVLHLAVLVRVIARACGPHSAHRQAVLRWTTCTMQLLARVLMAFH